MRLNLYNKLVKNYVAKRANRKKKDYLIIKVLLTTKKMMTNNLNNFSNSLIFLDLCQHVLNTGPHYYTSFTRLSQWSNSITEIISNARANPLKFQELTNTINFYKVPTEKLKEIPWPHRLGWIHNLIGLDISTHDKTHTLISALTTKEKSFIPEFGQVRNFQIFRNNEKTSYLNPIIYVIEKHNLMLETCNKYNLELNQKNKEEIAKLMIKAWSDKKYLFVK